MGEEILEWEPIITPEGVIIETLTAERIQEILLDFRKNGYNSFDALFSEDPVKMRAREIERNATAAKIRNKIRTMNTSWITSILTDIDTIKEGDINQLLNYFIFTSNIHGFNFEDYRRLVWEDKKSTIIERINHKILPLKSQISWIDRKETYILSRKIEIIETICQFLQEDDRCYFIPSNKRENNKDKDWISKKQSWKMMKMKIVELKSIKVGDLQGVIDWMISVSYDIGDTLDKKTMEKCYKIILRDIIRDEGDPYVYQIYGKCPEELLKYEKGFRKFYKWREPMSHNLEEMERKYEERKELMELLEAACEKWTFDIAPMRHPESEHNI